MKKLLIALVAAAFSVAGLFGAAAVLEGDSTPAAGGGTIMCC